MMDFHCHLLPGMDDGSDSVETTRNLLQMLAEQGVTQVAATSHFYASQEEHPEDFLRRRQQSLGLLGDTSGLPAILPGAEVAYFDGMGFCEDLRKLTLGDTNLILVEMPFYDWTERMISDVVQLKMQMGLQPVLAHVERYPGKKQLSKYLKVLARQGIAMQCNAEAFLSADSRRWALTMVKKGYVQFLGTDAHNLTGRAPKYAEAVEVLYKKLPAQIVEHLTTEI